MCGIVGIVSTEPVAGRIVEGLRRLEYRGYDSAGIATLVDGRIERRRAEGKLANLQAVLDGQPLGGSVGVGHTRWATHGAPTEGNAHPHATARLAVVHNGIIENFRELRTELTQAGHRFETQTDSEAIAHLVTHLMDGGLGPVEATQAALARLQGAFALGLIFTGHEDLVIGARRSCPLAVGHGDGENFLGSDALALAALTNRVTFLEEGDWVILTRAGIEVRDAAGQTVERPMRTMALSAGQIEKGPYRHFMAKEIHEQPQVVGDTLAAWLDHTTRRPVMPSGLPDLAGITRLSLVACGTSFYAAMVARYWIEHLARLPVDVDIASEFRYREPPLVAGTLALFVSQSGETADTLAALRHCKAQGIATAAIVNVPESSMAREAGAVLATHAGPEIGVASTKAFTCQLTVLAVLALALASARGTIDQGEEARLCEALSELPARMFEILESDERIAEIGREVAQARDVLYLGRGITWPIAMEGALKLKEISYIHAEGYAAGELKHGPIALIDRDVPVIVLAPHGALLEKTLSNMEEVRARGGRAILITDDPDVAVEEGITLIRLPKVDPLVSPLLFTIPVQLLAYHAAVAKGTDVDQPRNLAKAVTVE